QALDVVARVKVVYVVSQAVLPAAVRVQSGVQGSSAGATGRDGREALREAHAVLCQAVDVRRVNLLVAVTAELETHVVGDEQHDVARRTFRRRQRRGRRSQNQRSEEKDPSSHGEAP